MSTPLAGGADEGREERQDGGRGGGRARARAGAGAREHSLKSVDVDLPRDALVVFAGVSGSGKSSLAFGTLYAEAQRRYPGSRGSCPPRGVACARETRSFAPSK